MAMNAASHVVTTSPEAKAQLAHSNVLAHRHAPDRAKRPAAGKPSGEATAGSVYSANAYMMMISRVDNMVRRGESDPNTLDELRTHIAQHLAVLPEHSRQTIRALEGYAQLGADTFARLPDTLIRAVSHAEKAPTALRFMKDPAFVSYMRNEPRHRLYNPNGILRAS